MDSKLKRIKATWVNGEWFTEGQMCQNRLIYLFDKINYSKQRKYNNFNLDFSKIFAIVGDLRSHREVKD